MFGIVWVYNKLMNTPSMIVSPSTILLQPHVGGFLASDLDFFAHSHVTFGHQVAPQRCKLATIVAVCHCIGVYQSDEHSQHDCRALHHTFTAPCWPVSCLRSGKNLDFLQLSGQVWSSSGGITACRLLNSRCLALVRYITRSVTLPA